MDLRAFQKLKLFPPDTLLAPACWSLLRKARRMLSTTHRGESVVLRALPVGVLVVILLAIFSRIMTLGFDHDEHQFVASGTLLARQGMLPYRDYPYFHTPYLVFADAVLFAWIPYLLLAARGLSAVCGAATIGLI